MESLFDNVQQMLVLAPGLLFSLTIHEYAHARVALLFGDPTAYYQGRVSLNPLRHLDPIGTLMIFLIKFGWAKPVPVNPANLNPRGIGDIAVSLAGPFSNLAFAAMLGVMVRVALASGFLVDKPWGETALTMVLVTMAVNIVLCVFNLIPLFPLDGHHVLREILPAGQRYGYMAWQMRYGQMVLLALLFVPRLLQIPGILGMVFDYVIPPVMQFLTGVA
ncbi:MAG: site-2 protease family protein [Planctomycetota bacterium]|jgi:Zn-dependent protease